MGNLKETVCREVKAYAGKGLNGMGYFLSSDTDDVFAVIDIATFNSQHIAESSLIVRFNGEQIIVEQDLNDKPLVDALLQAGIPREQIVLAYAGESVEAVGIKP